MAERSLEQAQADIQSLLEGPAGKPPLGVLPNLQNPPYTDATGLFLLMLCIAISTISVFIRFYTKLFLIKSTAYEDCKFHPSQSGLSRY